MTAGIITLPDSFWDLVDLRLFPEECWEWRGPKRRDGYGLFQHDGRRQRAHRLSYAALEGPIPAGLVIDHLCRNRACVNPTHLEAVEIATNVRRGEPWNRNVTHCRRGHPLSGDNLYRNPANGQRVCRTCQRRRVLQAMRRRRAEAKAA